MKLKVKVVPGSSRNQIVGWLDGCLKVVVTAPPQAGKANNAVKELFAETLGLTKKSVEITSGKSSSRKVIRFNQCDEGEILKTLSQITKSG